MNDFNKEEGIKYLICVGNKAKWRRFDLILKELKKLDCGMVKLVIVGKGWNRL